MPRYFFVVCAPDGEVHDDTGGTDFPDKSGALAYARRIIRELKEAGGYDDPGWALIMRDEGGDDIAVLPFSDSNQHH
jgi:hypothetical protein